MICKKRGFFMKKLVYLLLLVFLISPLLAAEEEIRIFTLDTLSLFTGQEGEGYVSHYGRVYDVSETWSQGTHRGFMAGIDISEPIGDAPHGIAVLDRLPLVGYLAERLFTLEDLEEYHGQDGQPGYVSVGGIVHDVSETWSGGTHRGFVAGQDITEEIGGAPHGLTVLERLPVVGVIVELALTKEELAPYNGSDGNRGLIAVNGVIYDVSETWSGGTHRGFTAGGDITEEIGDSPHGLTVLEKLPVVGYLIE